MPSGKIYVAKYFPPSSKAEVQEMVNNLLAAFDRRIEPELDGARDKGAGQGQTQDLRVGVGYPDKWRDYARLVIRRDDPLGNTRERPSRNIITSSPSSDTPSIATNGG